MSMYEYVYNTYVMYNTAISVQPGPPYLVCTPHIVKALVEVDRLTLPRDLPTICFILSFYALSSRPVFY